MSDDESKNKELAKKLVEISTEERRQLQYMVMKEWDAGFLTGREAVEEILAMEQVIRIDIQTLRRAKSGQVHKPGDGGGRA